VPVTQVTKNCLSSLVMWQTPIAALTGTLKRTWLIGGYRPPGCRGMVLLFRPDVAAKPRRCRLSAGAGLTPEGKSDRRTRRKGTPSTRPTEWSASPVYASAPSRPAKRGEEGESSY
jgi:hypothetical protein